MNCIIVEDEKPAMNLMADNIRKIPFLNLIKCCKNTFEAGEALAQNKVDLVFLDVQMPVISGIQFLKTLRNPPLVVLTTAYEQYAIEGFELDVIDYLLKPFSFDRFLKAVTKAQEQLSFRNSTASQIKDVGFFFVYSEYRELKIPYRQVRYIEGLKDYVKIFLEDSKHPILTRLNLKGIETRLPQALFVRVHNSFIVNISKINSTQKTQLFIGDKTIPIGSSYAGSFFSAYKGNV